MVSNRNGLGVLNGTEMLAALGMVFMVIGGLLLLSATAVTALRLGLSALPPPRLMVPVLLYPVSVVLSLLILGGPVIRDFALAMMIGVSVGTYSTIYVASALLVRIERYQQA